MPIRRDGCIAGIALVVSRTIVLCIPPHKWSFIQHHTSACDLFEGVSSFGSPDEGFGVLIVVVFSEGHDSLLEILEDTTPDKEYDMAKAYKSEALAAVQ
jgi:hypothetical protein